MRRAGPGVSLMSARTRSPAASSLDLVASEHGLAGRHGPPSPAGRPVLRPSSSPTRRADRGGLIQPRAARSTSDTRRAASSLHPHRPVSPGRGRCPVEPGSHQPGATAQATAAAREERLSSPTMLARVPVRYVPRDTPLGDIGVAQSLHDELQHIQLARRQHERERLRGHTPKPLIKIDADRTSQNPPALNHGPNIIRPPPRERSAAMPTISPPLAAMPPGNRPDLPVLGRPHTAVLRQPRIPGYGAIHPIAEHHLLPAQNGRSSRDGRNQRPSRCATGVPECERTERRIGTSSRPSRQGLCTHTECPVLRMRVVGSSNPHLGMSASYRARASTPWRKPLCAMGDLGVRGKEWRQQSLSSHHDQPVADEQPSANVAAGANMQAGTGVSAWWSEFSA